MKDFYIKFPSESEAQSVLYTMHPAVLDEDGNELQAGYTTPKFLNIDTLGTLYEQAPDPLPDPYEPVAMAGWHVNVRAMPGEDTAELEPYAVVPANPRRVWA